MAILNLFLLFFSIHLNILLHAEPPVNQSVTLTTPYPSFCMQAAQNQNVFNSFRKNQIYKGIVETLQSHAGNLFAEVIHKEYPHLLINIKKIVYEDSVGGPIQYQYSHIGRISPTVLRYIKVVGDLQKEFGELKTFTVVEIGAGFGGQCKMMHDLDGFSCYTMIDLPQCTPLINKYLSRFRIGNTETICTSDLCEPIHCDLCISNYAFSEICREGQMYYIDTIIKYAQRGYIIYNNFPSINPLTITEFVSILKSYGKKVKVSRETPATGDPANPNMLITWTT